MKNFLKNHMSLRLSLILFVFFILLASVVIMGGLAFLLIRVFGVPLFHGPNAILPFLGMLLLSILLGTVLTAVVSNRTLKPLKKIIDATRRVAAGDFSVQVEEGSIPELEDLTTSFNKMVRELAGIETLRSDFVSDFSHEFKTPIVSVRGFAKLLRNKNLPEEERDEYVEIIIQESERLASLATNVLNLSKLESTGILTEKEHFRLDEQVRRAAALMEPRWREKNQNVTLALDDVVIYSNEDLLQQVWLNLIDNAVKFTPKGGSIDIRLENRGGQAVFSIADNGMGMDEAALAHLFDKFYQGDKSHTGSGNGLGLAMAQRIVALCGGSIGVESAPGRGSTFTLTLPLE